MGKTHFELITNHSDTPEGLVYPPPSIQGGSASSSVPTEPPRKLSRNTLDNIKAVVVEELSEEKKKNKLPALR